MKATERDRVTKRERGDRVPPEGAPVSSGNDRGGRPLRLRLALLLAVVVVMPAVAGAGCSGGYSVNGVAVSRSDIRSEVNRRLEVIRKKSPAELAGARGDRLRAETERQVATERLRAELMKQRAEKMRVRLPADEARRRLEAERARRGDERFRRELAEQGLTEALYAGRLEEKALVDAIAARVTLGITVTLDEAESFYLTHKDLFSRALMIRASHILLDSAGQADIIAEEAKRGRDFAELARTFSKDDLSRGAGGDLGWIENGTREPAFEEAAFALRPGEVSGAVRASDGFHVIKVTDRREAGTPSFEDVRDRAVEVLTGRKKEEAFSDWLRSAYANAHVRAGGAGEWDARLGMVVGR